MSAESTPKPAERGDSWIQKALSQLEPTRRASVEERLAKMPVSARRNFLRAATGEACPRDAIKSHCMECMDYNLSAIRFCT